MLFYNTHLHCYVVVEIKTTKFEPSFLGQLSGYVSCALGISEYELSKLFPKDFKGTLPSIEELEKELGDLTS